MTHTWSPEDYRQHAAFVPSLGGPLLERLAPRPGERILDLGCGDGALTEAIAATGAEVIGVDRSAEMVRAARARGLDARLADARDLPFDEMFDGVLSNAVLHWILEPDAVLQGVRRALKPGGRFVAELGGHTNIAALTVALRAVLARHGHAPRSPWYFPTAEEYAARVRAAGLVVRDIALFPRPTVLPTDMTGWFRTFGGPALEAVPEAARPGIVAEIVDLLRPSLCDGEGRWTVDYTRLRVVAERPR
jgi:SAM-dependent methyltransferase